MNDKVFQAKLGKAGDFYITLTAYLDHNTNPNEWDGNSDEYIKAYRSGLLTFVSVKVACVQFGVELGSAWLSGVEYGSVGNYNHYEAEVCEEVLSQHSWLIDEAVAEAKLAVHRLQNSWWNEFSRDVAIGKYSTGELVK